MLIAKMPAGRRRYNFMKFFAGFGWASFIANFTHKIFFWSAPLFHFAVLEFLLDFRRAHS